MKRTWLHDDRPIDLCCFSKQHNPFTRSPIKHNRGFTLIELSVVVFLLGTMLLLALPTLRNALVTDPLKTSVNRIVSTAEILSHEARRDRVDILMHFNIDQGKIWTTSADMTPEAEQDKRQNAWQLPGGVRIIDIEQFEELPANRGEVTLRFYSRGYRDSAIVRLGGSGIQYTLIVEPFLPDIDVREGYYRRQRDGTFQRVTSW